MAESIDDNIAVNSRKRKRDESKIDIPPSTKKLTPVTIMVTDTIGTVKSRKLLNILLVSLSTTTLINKRCLPKACKPYPISESRNGLYTNRLLSIINNGGNAQY